MAGAGVWRVVHEPRVAVRLEPSTGGEIVTALHFGEEARPLEARGPWLRLGGLTPGWVLSDGSSLGLGPLLERIDTKPMRLRVRHPASGDKLPDLELPGDAAVAQALQELAVSTNISAKSLMPCGPSAFPSANALQPETTLWEAGFRDGSEFQVLLIGEAEKPETPSASSQPRCPEPLPPHVSAALWRLECGDGGSADVEAAVAAGREREAVQALLAALAAGRARAQRLLWRWACSPRLDVVEQSAGAGGGPRVVLLLGWGGSSVEQLEGPRQFWQDRGCATVATTLSPFRAEAQAARVLECVPEGSQVLVHSFSNLGLLCLDSLLRCWQGQLCGVVVDSAPDNKPISQKLLRMVANGMVRALCAKHAVRPGPKEEEALMNFSLLTVPQQGDILKWEDDPRHDSAAVVRDSAGKVRGLLASEGALVQREFFLLAAGHLSGRPLTTAEAESLAKSMVVVEMEDAPPDFAKVLDQCRSVAGSGPLPLLFLYSRTDTVIKASAVEDFIHTSTSPGQARVCCFEGSHHVKHFEKHRERYTAELEAFAGPLGF